MKTVRETSVTVIQEVQKIEKKRSFHTDGRVQFSPCPSGSCLRRIFTLSQGSGIEDNIFLSALLTYHLTGTTFPCSTPGFPVFTNSSALSREHSYH